MRRSLSLAATLALIALASLSLSSRAQDAAKEATPEVKLSVELKRATFAANEFFEFTVTLRNAGEAPVRLVEPGDGSEWGWRTPIIGWSVLPADSKEAHPEDPPKPTGGRCGNVNAIKADEVFSLKPGEERRFEQGWWGAPRRLAPGKYRAVLIYENVPSKDCGGLAMGEHSEQALADIKRSTPCKLRSNELLFTITPAKGE